MQKIKKFLVCGFRSIFKDRESYFKGVKELPPATNLLIDNNFKKSSKKYWNLKFLPQNISEKDLYDKIEELLYNSIRVRLRSDLPIAFCLSGGIDASSLVAITQKISNKKVSTFSIIDKDERYNETHNIQLISKFLKCESHLVETSSTKFIENMEKIISYFNAPIPTISYYVHNQLTKKIKKSKFSVAVSGTGADEIFTGYYDHYLYWLSEMRSHKKFKNFFLEMKKGYGKHINNSTKRSN